MKEMNIRAQMEREMLLEDPVIVHVWKACGASKSVGHISIQTDKYYISLWPNREDVGITDIGKTFESYEVKSYEEDFKKEGRKCNHTFLFCKLSQLGINSCWEDKKIVEAQKKVKDKWTLIPLGIFTKDAESCASLAWKLLEAGGISKLFSHADRSSATSGGMTEGSQLASGGLFSSHAVGDSSREALKNSLKVATLGSLISTEMAFNRVVKGPDFLAELLKTAKKNEEKEFLVSDIPEAINQKGVEKRGPKK